MNTAIFWGSLASGLCMNAVLFFTFLKLFPSIFSGVKDRAWLLTLFSAAFMSVSGLFFLAAYVKSSSLQEYAAQMNVFSVSLSAVFTSYLIADLGIGSIYYRSSIHPLSGWFHHSLYTVLLYYLCHAGLAGVFALYGILEIPTLVMSVGSILPSLRADRLFGSSFFLTRILFHLYLTNEIRLGYPNSFYYLISLGIFPLHAMWFHGWVKQQLRKKKQTVIVVSSHTKKQTPKTLNPSHFSEGYAFPAVIKTGMSTNQFARERGHRDGVRAMGQEIS